MTARGAAALALAALATLAVGIPPGTGASLTLADAEREQALAYGRTSATRETGYDAEWQVRSPGGDVVTVLTPFHRLAIAARHAAFRNEPLKRSEPERLLRQQKDRLLLRAELRGRRPEFTRYFVPELLVRDRTLKPAFVQNDRNPERLEDGAYLARCTYAFPTKELTGKSRVTLLVRDADDREVTRFVIDLAAMR